MHWLWFKTPLPMDSKWQIISKMLAKLIIFKRKHRVTTKHLNFRVRGQKVNPSNSVKYLGVFLAKWFSDMDHPSNKSYIYRNLTELLAHWQRFAITPPSYYSLVNSHLIYAWSNMGTNKLKSAQESSKAPRETIIINNKFFT